MINIVGKFEKVSTYQLGEDLVKFGYLSDYECDKYSPIVLKNIILPKRGTKHSAGYDFVCPISLKISPGESIIIPTGVRCKISEGWYLGLHVRSSVGIKKGLQLSNTTGVIDADYYNAKNEGHILLSLKNTTGTTVELKEGERIAQGIFSPFGITEDDENDTKEERFGGIGSTNKNK